ncbi:hypothetical protein F2Q69_00005580 [Brassica cretica]|uniref:Uncharacterized protein n=1 Tax=Brassica cretica TaxID=69181 RepID=A0A8S9P7H5_BRACR|nr:hypothetical protein F2Q69_00005580 [Brassica cretica]
MGCLKLKGGVWVFIENVSSSINPYIRATVCHLACFRLHARAHTCPDAWVMLMHRDTPTSRWLAAWLECMCRDTQLLSCRSTCSDCSAGTATPRASICQPVLTAFMLGDTSCLGRQIA